MPEGMEGGLDAQVIYDPPNLTYPCGAYICVVDVDPDTAAVSQTFRAFAAAPGRPPGPYGVCRQCARGHLLHEQSGPHRPRLERHGKGAATALYSGVYLASQSLAPRSGRKVLVIISDGGNTVNGTTYDQALEQALRGEVMVYPIIDVPIAASAGRDLAGNTP